MEISILLQIYEKGKTVKLFDFCKTEYVSRNIELTNIDILILTCGLILRLVLILDHDIFRDKRK